ncbi:MAG: response regulator [Alphaproteobacteria bacterium]|nr:MAG: response regulator [Alphaproteobacteria bacterium]
MSLRQSLSIMVVDDMSVSRGLITMALDQIGVSNYATENSGESAWKKLVAAPVHLVISDYNMPGMDGLALLAALRQHRATQRIGFILVSGRIDNDMIAKGRQLGLNNFLKKPFDVPAFRRCIEQVTGPL